MEEMTIILIISMVLAYVFPILGLFFAYRQYKKVHEKKEGEK
jgi:uncharacterized protein YneF (UPF0154 family)